jgi:phosphatidylglycerol lysyltransferase
MSLERFRRAVPALLGLALFLAALEVLSRELHALTWRELTADVLAMPGWRLALAVLLTAANYAVMTGYDQLALAYAGRRLPRARVALTSALAYAVANNVGFAMLSGATVRYRFYTRWGVTAEDLSRIVFSYAVTFWLGALLLGGFSLVISPLPDALAIPGPSLVAAIGWLLMLLPALYVGVTFVRRRPLCVRGFTLPVPSTTTAAAQVAISTVDWMLAGAVLYVLLPASSLGFLGLLGAFMTAQLLGLASHVPGGVGVFEGLMVLLLDPFLDSAALLPALVVYRAVYYLLPLAAALLVLLADELRQRREQTLRVRAMVGRLAEQLTPRAMAILTFLAGVILLMSGATPAAAGRLALVHRLVPLGIIETSHFAGSVIGAGLLVLSQGLARRLDAAYFLSAAGIAIGIGASLLKGGDYEEAAVLGLVLVLLWRARATFDRRAALFETRFGPRWIATIAGALVASIWLARFAFKHVEYSSELWWQFGLHGEASRSLRASVGAAVALLIVALARMLRPAPHEAEEPTDAEIETIGPLIRQQASTFPYLAYLRDKTLLFDEQKTGFVMYAVQRRTWIALGDPVGPPARVGTLIRLFLERCDDFDGVPAFYEIGREHLHRYADFGLTFVKLGEEARVDLNRFTLDGGGARKFRQTLRRLDKDGVAFRVVPAEQTGAIIDELRVVSDDWLREKTAAEKGFSLGFFKPDYLARFPVAVMEREGRVVAFANIWCGGNHVELSFDLMRYRADAPENVMEALVVHLLMWGRAQGYRWFSLGMAPLSGFESSPVGPLWNRLGSFLYEHGDRFYNFQGLRAYKEKFHPEWEPRYLAYPGGLRLAGILADVAALVAGGYRRIFPKGI